MFGTGNPEDPEVKMIRRGFIRKVYSILTVQLLITGSFISIFCFYQPICEFGINNLWLFYTSIGVLFVTMIALACCGELRRKSPINFILLGLFTLAESFMLGLMTCLENGDVVLMAVGITAILVLSLTLFAFQTKIDFTICKGFLFVGLIVLLVFGIVAGILFQFGKTYKILHLAYSCLGALLFSLYIICDTQLMMGGEHKYTISPEEYVFAALMLYVDIINLFLYILMIIKAVND